MSSNWGGVPQGSPQGQTLRALPLRDNSVIHSDEGVCYFVRLLQYCSMH